MTALTSGKVLVTGANGYVAVWVVQYLLVAGFSVRATVRSEAKTTHLRKLFASYGDKLEFVIVEDIAKPGAFDEAVKGVDAIEHTASPFTFAFEDPNDLIIPAVHGTTSILESTLKHGSSVKRFVLLSSTAAVEEMGAVPRTYDENSWDDQAVKDVEVNGKNAHPVNKYCASKTLAERAGWDFYEKHKANLSWDFTVLNPPFIYGPVLNEIDAPEHLGTSMHQLYTIVCKGEYEESFLKAFSDCWVDVRDVASAHVLSLTKAEAGGERIIFCEGKFNWYEWLSIGRSLSPDVSAFPGSYDPSTAQYLVTLDTSKAARILGIQYFTKEVTLRDVFADFEAKGWWGKK
ncbi:NAD(P)-binding protein [Amylocystis lapponica]|nr:NAD(P)-binding protein [Amylocystis lapponica]